LKRTITEKLDTAFSQLQESWKPLVRTWKIPLEGVDLERGKIFKGENYRGYPYVIMDFPKRFSREEVFAVRTMCWWGHEFSITLHLQGEALRNILPDLTERLRTLTGTECYFCVNRTPWEYEFTPVNYRLLDDCTDDEVFSQAEINGFIKIARRLSLSDHNKLEPFGKETAELIGRFLMKSSN
jgi:hypothetical protein